MPVTERFGVSARPLQRLFRRYVGVGPKWVLQRFRLHDAQLLLESGDAPDLATLAADLGWSDQAHFSRDFQSTVGMPPGRYAADPGTGNALPRSSTAPGRFPPSTPTEVA